MGERREGQPVQNLEDINFDIRRADQNEPRKTETETVIVLFNGKPINLRIEKISAHDFLQTADLTIQAYAEDKLVAFLKLMATWKSNNDWVLGARVENYRDSNLPKLGRALWEIIPRFAQNIANEWGVTITHTVTRHPDKELGADKWDKIFLPLLEKYGYSPAGKVPNIDELYELSGCDTWKKKYTPQK